MTETTRRHWLRGAAAIGAAAAEPQLLVQGAPIRIGYAIARTGSWAAGAQVSREPNYLLWAEQVNAAGGLVVKGGAKQPAPPARPWRCAGPTSSRRRCSAPSSASRRCRSR